MPTIHHTYGGSTMHRTMQCPAWVLLSKKMPPSDETASEFADEGTLLHLCMEAVVCDRLHPVELLELSNPPYYKNQVLTEDHVNDKLIPAYTALQTALQRFDVDIAQVHVEPFVELIPGEAGGSIDLLGFSRNGKTALVVDYKFGHNTVHADRNVQLLFYALCASVDPKTMHTFENVEQLALCVIQPNGDGDPLRVWETHEAILDEFEQPCYDAIHRTKQPDPKPVPGLHCRYCPAEAICPAKTGLAARAARLPADDVSKLSEALTMIPQLESWIKAVHKLAHDQLERGVQIEGFKLVNKRATRQWADPDEVEQLLKNARRIKIAECQNHTLKSPAQMEKVFKTKGLDFAPLSDKVVAVSSGTTIAPADDKRPDAAPHKALAELAERLY